MKTIRVPTYKRLSFLNKIKILKKIVGTAVINILVGSEESEFILVI